MSRLTVTEKEHWKQRIENRIDKAIDAIAAQDTKLLPKIREQAGDKAHITAGTSQLVAELQSVEEQTEALKEQEESLKRNMWIKALGEQAVRNGYEYSLRSDFDRLISKYRDRHEEELLAKSKLGKKILKLRAEKEALLDTVWLATSSTQIRDLWSRVSEVLGEDATPLQQQILNHQSDQD